MDNVDNSKQRIGWFGVGVQVTHPLGVKILSFSISFWQNNRLADPLDGMVWCWGRVWVHHLSLSLGSLLWLFSCHSFVYINKNWIGHHRNGDRQRSLVELGWWTSRRRHEHEDENRATFDNQRVNLRQLAGEPLTIGGSIFDNRQVNLWQLMEIFKSFSQIVKDWPGDCQRLPDSSPCAHD